MRFVRSQGGAALEIPGLVCNSIDQFDYHVRGKKNVEQNFL